MSTRTKPKATLFDPTDRPRCSEFIGIRVTAEDKDRLTREANRRKVGLSTMLRIAVDSFLRRA
jgi:hypothetical protein